MKKPCGSYVLVIQAQRESSLCIGKLGIVGFKKGYYAYVGSALSGLSARLQRHLRKEKKIRWHIDYFLAKTQIQEIWYSEEKAECELAHGLSTFPMVPKFGCSDCTCSSHLFYASSYQRLVEALVRLGMKRYVC
jgi:Uri superfamily endonuclease